VRGWGATEEEADRDVSGIGPEGGPSGTWTIGVACHFASRPDPVADSCRSDPTGEQGKPFVNFLGTPPCDAPLTPPVPQAFASVTSTRAMPLTSPEPPSDAAQERLRRKAVPSSEGHPRCPGSPKDLLCSERGILVVATVSVLTECDTTLQPLLGTNTRTPTPGRFALSMVMLGRRSCTVRALNARWDRPSRSAQAPAFRLRYPSAPTPRPGRRSFTGQGRFSGCASVSDPRGIRDVEEASGLALGLLAAAVVAGRGLNARVSGHLLHY